MAKASAILSYLRKLIGVRPSKAVMDLGRDVGGDIEGYAEKADKPAEEETPLPMFYVGDNVLIYSPYTAEFLTQEWNISPDYFEVTAVKYDEEQEVFRYQLKDGEPDDWYSEDWLSLPAATSFIREWVTLDDTEIGGDLMEQKTELEGEILTKALDDELKGREIDRFLDMLREGDAEEREAAEKELRKLTESKTRGVAE